MTIAKSAVASTMQTRRTIATRPSTKRSNRASSAKGPSRHGKGGVAPPPSLKTTRSRSEALLAVEDESHGLLDPEPLRLRSDEPRHRLHERRLVRADDLGEVALELLQVLELGDLPGAGHRAQAYMRGFLERLLLLVVELVPQLH